MKVLQSLILGMALSFPTAHAEEQAPEIAEASAWWHDLIIGGQCEQLFDLTTTQIAELVQNLKHSQQRLLCTPEDGSACSDYDVLISDWGYMKPTGGFGTGCTVDFE